MVRYAAREVTAGNALRHITRHMLGLFHGEPRARLWRRMLSDAERLARNDPVLLLEALAVVDAANTVAAAA
jgi:tRNA-dihydrouridine synthase A